MSPKNKKLSAILEEKQCVLERIDGLDLQGQILFAFLLMKKNRLEEFRKALSVSDVDLAKWGVVVAYGSGTCPDGFEKTVLDAITKVA